MRAYSESRMLSTFTFAYLLWMGLPTVSVSSRHDVTAGFPAKRFGLRHSARSPDPTP